MAIIKTEERGRQTADHKPVMVQNTINKIADKVMIH